MALVEWAQSWVPGTFPAERLPDLYAHLEREAGRGPVRVGKDSGLIGRPGPEYLAETANSAAGDASSPVVLGLPGLYSIYTNSH